jgi:hypothetical protein
MTTTKDYTPKDFERRFGSTLSDGTPQSTAALVRSVHALTSDELSEAGFLAFASQSRSLEKDGAQFLAACYWHLVMLDCPGKAIDFVVFLTGITGGDAEKQIALTDVEIAEAMNVTDRTIREKRKALKAWMKKVRYGVVEVVEGEYDYKLKKHGTTKYRALVAPMAAKIVLLARNGSLWREEDAKSQKKALKEAAEEVQWDTLDAPAPVKERKQKKPQTAAAEMQARRKSLLTQFRKVIRLEYKQGGDIGSMWSELVHEMQSIFDEEANAIETTGGVMGLCRPVARVEEVPTGS